MKAAFFDVDGTLTDARVWQGIFDYFTARKLRRWTHATFLAYHYPLYLIRKLRLMGEGTFRAQWASHLAWYVRGFTVDQGLQVWRSVVEDFLSRHWRTDTRGLLVRHQEAGHPVMLVSSGPLPLLNEIAGELGVDHFVGTRFDIQAGRYTGRHIGPVCIDGQKAAMAKAYVQAQGLAVDFQDSVAYADSMADLHLLEMVGHPVATYPDEPLRRIAQDRAWGIFPQNHA